MELTNGNNIEIKRNVIFYPIIEFRMVQATKARWRVFIIYVKKIYSNNSFKYSWNIFKSKSNYNTRSNPKQEVPDINNTTHTLWHNQKMKKGIKKTDKKKKIT